MSVLDAPLLPDLPRQVFLLTDGEVSDPDALIKCTAQRVNKARVFTFGIGTGASRYLCSGVLFISFQFVSFAFFLLKLAFAHERRLHAKEGEGADCLKVQTARTFAGFHAGLFLLASTHDVDPHSFPISSFFFLLCCAACLCPSGVARAGGGEGLLI